MLLCHRKQLNHQLQLQYNHTTEISARRVESALEGLDMPCSVVPQPFLLTVSSSCSSVYDVVGKRERGLAWYFGLRWPSLS